MHLGISNPYVMKYIEYSANFETDYYNHQRNDANVCGDTLDNTISLIDVKVVLRTHTIVCQNASIMYQTKLSCIHNLTANKGSHPYTMLQLHNVPILHKANQTFLGMNRPG